MAKEKQAKYQTSIQKENEETRKVAELGIVVIGRNEGERLHGCLRSAAKEAVPLIYVDSASSDRSVQVAREMGIPVVEFDASMPLGQSRARNAGLAVLLQLDPAIRFVQFVDGDCELIEGWLKAALRQLKAMPQVAIVSGRLNERFPNASVYNKLCEIEWDQPAGESPGCGGICMVRVEPFQQVGGFNPDVLAGEEPELCIRLRNRGWKIFRIDVPMAVHDAAIMRFGQWWRRAIRGGYAYAQGASLHGGFPHRHYIKEIRRAWLWGLLIPLVTAITAWPSSGFSLLLLLLYPVNFYRIYRQARRRPLERSFAAAYAAGCSILKFAEIYGMWKFAIRQLRGGPFRLIEHR